MNSQIYIPSSRKARSACPGSMPRKIMKQFYVYILANKKGGTLYVGLTSDLPKRTWEHKNGVIEGFTKRYSVKRLVHYEIFDRFEQAAEREKSLKRWRRQWKINLIEEQNPDWNDLYKKIAS